MYSDKIVVAIKVGGRVLRESGDIVALPFGAEYSILLKNLNSVRTQVSVSIDGKDIADGSRLILGPNSSIDLERFIRNGNLAAGNRFKFIERTAAVEAHRGVGAEDGLIRVEAWKERVVHYQPSVLRNFRSFDSDDGGARMTSFTSSNMVGAASASVGPAPEQERSGITAPGSESRQQFYSSMGFPLEAHSTVMVLRLRGDIAGAQVVDPVTVDVRPECQTCGKKGAANDEFCSRCGASLVVIA